MKTNNVIIMFVSILFVSLISFLSGLGYGSTSVYKEFCSAQKMSYQKIDGKKYCLKGLKLHPIGWIKK